MIHFLALLFGMAPPGTTLRFQADLPLPGFESRRVKAIHFQGGRRGGEKNRNLPSCGITFSGSASFQRIYALQRLPAGEYILQATSQAPVIGAFRDSWTLLSADRSIRMVLYCQALSAPVTVGEMIEALGPSLVSISGPN